MQCIMVETSQRHLLARIMWRIASKIIIYCVFIVVVHVVIKSCCYSRIRQVLLTSRNVGTLLRASRKEEAPQKRLQTFGVQLKGNNENTLKDSIGIESTCCTINFSVTVRSSNH